MNAATQLVRETPTAKGVSTQNRKLVGSSIADCPEIEEATPCKYFQIEGGAAKSPLCPGCWSAQLWPLRTANWSCRQVTSRTGIIRLGTWREILPEDYAAFKTGQGKRANGENWHRPDFPRRRFFLITRGLLPLSFYEEVAADPYCLNVQVSVDIVRLKDGSITQNPDDEKLAGLLELPKVLLRFKTRREGVEYKGVHYDANTADFLALRERLGVPWMRVLETPLRLGDHSYQTTTPLEAAGVPPASFLRCNSSCADCPGAGNGSGENRVLGCAITPRIRDLLERVGNGTPLRVPPEPPHGISWTKIVRQAIQARGGGRIRLRDLYEDVKALEPGVVRNALWDVKVRQVVQRLGTLVQPGLWDFPTTTTSPILSQGTGESP